MPRVQACGQQSKRRNHREINVVSYGDKLRALRRVQFANRDIIAWIDVGNAGVFINNFRLVIAHLVYLVRDFVEVGLPNDYPNQFCAANPHTLAGVSDPGYSNYLCRASLIRIRIKRQLDVERLLAIYWSWT